MCPEVCGCMWRLHTRTYSDAPREVVTRRPRQLHTTLSDQSLQTFIDAAPLPAVYKLGANCNTTMPTCDTLPLSARTASGPHSPAWEGGGLSSCFWYTMSPSRQTRRRALRPTQTPDASPRCTLRGSYTKSPHDDRRTGLVIVGAFLRARGQAAASSSSASRAAFRCGPSAS